MDYTGSDRLLKVTEVGQRLGLSRSAVYEILDAWLIPSVAPSAGGRSRRVKESAVNDYIDRLTERQEAVIAS